MTVYEILNKIQVELKAPKNQRNKFGNYNYRSCEDILEAVKPFLSGSVITITDDLVDIGGRHYVKATITITYDGQSISASAFAREPESQKGMSESQITGAASSYARKYSANGLFLIDDTKDADTMDNSHKEPSRANKQTIDTLYEWAEKLHQSDPEKASWLTTEIKKGLTQERANDILGRLK